MMSALFIYLIRASIVTLIIFSLYSLYQKKENFFVLNRVYLLLGLLGALLLPLFNYDLLKYIFTEQGREGYLLTYQFTSIQLPEIIIGTNNIAGNSLNWIHIIGYIYFTGFATGLILLLVRFLKLILLSVSHENINKEGIRFVVISDDLPVFSFFNNIFISKEILDSFDASKIIDHEKVHIRQFHSFDLLVAEVLCIVLWFNPLSYLLKKYIRENHEFLADEKVIRIDNNPTAYRLLLLEYSSGIKTNSLTHNFSYSLLKRRLHMIKKQKRNLNFSVSILAVAIAFSLILFACSQPDKSLPIEQNDAKEEVFTEAEVMPEYSEEKDSVYKVVEVMPEYPGGIPALMEYLGSNIKYPDQAKKDTVQGRVFISFVIEKDGQVSSAKVLRGIGSGCDEESLRVVNSMPKWTPGKDENGNAVRVAYNLPIKYKLN